MPAPPARFLPLLSHRLGRFHVPGMLRHRAVRIGPRCAARLGRTEYCKPQLVFELRSSANDTIIELRISLIIENYPESNEKAKAS